MGHGRWFVDLGFGMDVFDRLKMEQEMARDGKRMEGVVMDEGRELKEVGRRDGRGICRSEMSE